MTLTDLTERQRQALVDLSEMPPTSVWLPLSKSVLSVCHNLKRMGLAKYHYGCPIGFSITEAGRSLLAQEEKKGPKLTKKQRECLEAVSAGLVREVNGAGGTWHISGASPTVVRRLGSLGLIWWTEIIGGDAMLTEAGRSILAEVSNGDKANA